jgi:peptide/nickel transport system permease protein
MMTRFIAKRLLDLVVVVFLALTAVFGMMRLSGDPVTLMLPPDASAEFAADLRARLGLDAPLWQQYTRFLSGAVTGDFGESLHHSNTPALDLVLDRLPNSLLLSLSGIVLAIAFAVPTGAISALLANTWLDRCLTVISVFFQSMPNFWFGLMLVIMFSVTLGWFPTGGMGTWRHVLLPTVALAAYAAARIQRLTRSSMLEVLNLDYIRTATAKGASVTVVVFRHALKNALIPVITLAALQFGQIFGSAVIVETIFSWPGIGRLVVQSIEFRDFPVVLASVFAISVTYTLVNFLADLTYGLVDPQIRYA